MPCGLPRIYGGSWLPEIGTASEPCVEPEPRRDAVGQSEHGGPPQGLARIMPRTGRAYRGGDMSTAATQAQQGLQERLDALMLRDARRLSRRADEPRRRP